MITIKVIKKALGKKDYTKKEINNVMAFKVSKKENTLIRKRALKENKTLSTFVRDIVFKELEGGIR